MILSLLPRLKRRGFLFSYKSAIPISSVKTTTESCQENIPKISLQAGGKAVILSQFKALLRKSRIPELYYFNTSDWESKKSDIVRHIFNTFQSTIIIRSSCFAEDTGEKSNAGKFTSISYVNPQKIEEVANAIEIVIKSYGESQILTSKSKVLIQTQVLDTITSGVVFTFDPKNSSPYYIINYDDTEGNTESVTSGLSGKQIRIFRGHSSGVIPQKWEKLIDSIKEIEMHCDRNNLDIEFAIDKNENIYIFQVRSLFIDQDQRDRDFPYFKKINTLKNSFAPGTCLSNMAFWNPAEIIGEKAQYLDSSLYKNLVLKNSWNDGIARIGYTKIKSPLYVNLVEHTYINVNLALASLMPKDLPVQLKSRLTNTYLERLKLNPSLHDKIEFEIIPNCFNFGLKQEFSKPDYVKYTPEELGHFENSLHKITNQMFSIWDKEISKAEKECTQINNDLERISSNTSWNEKLSTALSILSRCKEVSIPHFAAIARLAFVGKSIQNSLLLEGIITKSEYQAIIDQIETVASHMQNDQGTHEYAHLRSGTYNITKLPYSKSVKNNLKVKTRKKPKNNLSEETKRKIESACIKNKLHITGDELINFMNITQIKRESFKLMFTKQISFSLELIAEAGDTLGFSRDELAYLDLKLIEKASKLNPIKAANLWKGKIAKRKKERIINNRLYLPDFISSPDDFEFIEVWESKPNYITQNIVTAQCYVLDANKIESKGLKGKIVVIENADPGYDWIFGCGIKGLVTKYGGVASHMAIRCNEFNLPAILGCGNRMYEKISSAKHLTINCLEEKFQIHN